MGLLFCGSVLQAQTLTQAKQMYNEGKFAEAKPVFERLVKQVPSNASYNHWYGVCCYETGELEKAIKPLSFAVKRKVQEAYRYFGAHLCEQDGQAGAVFRVWAPHANAVSVVGDFNNWAPGDHPMQKVADGQPEDRARKWMQFSYNMRMLLMVVWLIVALAVPFFNWVAALVPLLMPRLTIGVMQATGMYHKEKGDTLPLNEGGNAKE